MVRGSPGIGGCTRLGRSWFRLPLALLRLSSSQVLLALTAEDRGAGVRPAFLAAVGAVQWVFGGCGGWSYRPGFGYRCERPIQLVEVMGLACVAYRARLHGRQSRAGE